MTETEQALAVRVGVLEGVVDDLLAALVDADKTRHYNPDPDISHAHAIFDERTQTKLDGMYARFGRLQERRTSGGPSLEGAARKYVGPATTGAAAAGLDQVPA